MDLASDATHYQGHKDDASEWGEPERPRDQVAPLRLDATISVRLTADQEDRIRARARHLNQTLSEYIRQAALRDCDRPGAPEFFIFDTTMTALGQLTDPTRPSVGLCEAWVYISNALTDQSAPSPAHGDPTPGWVAA